MWGSSIGRYFRLAVDRVFLTSLILPHRVYCGVLGAGATMSVFGIDSKTKRSLPRRLSVEAKMRSGKRIASQRTRQTVF